MAVKEDHRRAPQRREQILNEAQKLFLDHGLNAVTTRQIARAVGISQPSLYAHFPNRDAIAVELSVRAFRRLEERIAAVAAEVSGLDRVRRLSQAYIAFGLEEPAAYRVAFIDDIAAENTVEHHRGLQAGMDAFGVLRAAVSEIVQDPGEVELAAQSIWIALHGLVSILMARPEFPFVEQEVLVGYYIDHVILKILTDTMSPGA